MAERPSVRFSALVLVSVESYLVSVTSSRVANSI